MPTRPLPETVFPSGARHVLPNYDVLLCDVWGVVHDGRIAIQSSCDSLLRFREGGGTVILVSNVPVPPDAVARILDDKQVPRSAWDDIVSSGGLALEHIAASHLERIHRIGPPARDAAFFAALPPDVPLADADAIACTGPFDDRTEIGETYRERLREPARRGVQFLCVNPDLVVHVGDELLPCAGALAVVYEELGGPVLWAGKPHAIAYEAGLRKAAALRGGKPIDRARVLGIGDAVRTDLGSAAAAGVDAWFVAGGIHRDDVLDNGQLAPERVRSAFEVGGFGARYAAVGLVW